MKARILALPALWLGASVACSKYETEFSLFNDDVEPVHIFITGEEMGPGNRLEPGDGRVTTIKEPEPGEFTYYVYAGRNGATIDELRWTVTFQEACSRQLHEIEASWIPDQHLTTGLRMNVERECE